MENVWRVNVAGDETYRRPYGYDNLRRSGREPRAIVQYGISGELDWHDVHGHVRIRPRHVVLFTGNEASRFGLDPGNEGPYRCAWLSLAGGGIDVYWRSLIERFGAIHGPDDGFLLARLRRLDRGSAQPVVLAFIAELVEFITATHAARQSPVERAIARLAADPCADWSVKRLAAETGVSREHLTEVFTARYGESPGAWLLRRRLEHASELLRETGRPVGEIARVCGLGSARRLSRALARTGAGTASTVRAARSSSRSSVAESRR